MIASMRPYFIIFILFFSALTYTFLIMGETFWTLDTSIPGEPNDDAFQGIYLHHMVHRSLQTGHWTFTDTQQFFPHGYHVPSTNGGNYLEMILSGIMRIFFPWPTWYGAAHFLWIPINILCFIPLGRYLWKSTSLSLAVACIWSSLPFTLSFISYGRLTQTVQFAIPLTILGFLYVQETKYKHAPLFLGTALALCAWSYWFFAIFLILLSPIFFLGGRKEKGFRTQGTQYGIAAGTALLLTTPLIFIVYAPLLQGGILPPPPISTLSISPIFPDAIRIFGTKNLIWPLFPLSIWILSAVGLIAGKRRWRWGALALLSVLFSMGPAILHNNLVWFSPYYVLWKTVPILDRLLHPERWMLVGGIFFCILAGEGWMVLSQRLKSIKKQTLFLYASLCIPIITCFELRQKEVIPLKHWTYLVSDVWTEAEKSEGGLIIMPIMRAQLSSQYQSIHKRPTLGGMVENQPWTYSDEFRDMIEGNGLLMDLFERNEGNTKPFSLYQQDLDELHQLGFSEILFSKEEWNRLANPRTQNTNMVEYLSRILGAPQYQNTNGDSIWSIPKKGKAGRSPAAGSSIRNIGPPDPVPEGAPPL